MGSEGTSGKAGEWSSDGTTGAYEESLAVKNICVLLVLILMLMPILAGCGGADGLPYVGGDGEAPSPDGGGVTPTPPPNGDTPTPPPPPGGGDTDGGLQPPAPPVF